MKTKIKRFFHYLYISIRKPEMEVLPGNLAFFFMMMIIPLLTILATVIANLDVGKATLYDALITSFPDNIATLISSLAGTGSNDLRWFIWIGSLLLASSGTYSIIVTSNSIYGIKKSNYFMNKIKSIFLVVILISLFVLLLIIPTISSKVLTFIANLTKTNMATNIFFTLYKVLKYPVTFLLVFIFVKLLYKFSPSGKFRKRTSYGALFTSVLLVIVTWGYSYYIEYFSDFETIYGGISNILILMFWINIISYIFVLGMNINAVREKMITEDLQEEQKEEKIEEEEKDKKEDKKEDKNK